VTLDALRDNAVPVTTRRLALEAKKTSPAFKTKSLAAQAARSGLSTGWAILIGPQHM
jgi:hypothetical protein